MDDKERDRISALEQQVDTLIEELERMEAETRALKMLLLALMHVLNTILPVDKYGSASAAAVSYFRDATAGLVADVAALEDVSELRARSQKVAFDDLLKTLNNFFT